MQQRNGEKTESPVFPKKGGLGNIQNYGGIVLIFRTAKVYKAMLLNRMKPEIVKILWKNQNSCRRNRSINSLIDY